jgi:RNA polymerase sigma-70 factor (ECF subfamily)
MSIASAMLPSGGSAQTRTAAATKSPVSVAALFDAHATSVARCAERVLGPGPHVEDVVQEVFLVAHRRADVLTHVQSPRAWLLGVCLRHSQHQIRSKMRRRGLIDRLLQRDVSPVPPSADTGAVRSEARLIVRRALAGLSDAEREVFVMYELEDLNGKEIAEALSVPEKTVWSRLSRARKEFSRRTMGRDLGMNAGGGESHA